MATTLAVVHIYVDATAAATTFYRDALGLTVQSEVENEGFHWITLTSPADPSVQIVLSEPQAGRSAEDGEALARLLAKGELGSVQFRTDDLAALFDTVAAVPGAEVVQEPMDQFWGVRDAAVRDPAGNLLRIQQA